MLLLVCFEKAALFTRGVDASEWSQASSRAAGTVLGQHSTGLGGQQTPAGFPAPPFLCSTTSTLHHLKPSPHPFIPHSMFFVWVEWVELTRIQSRDSWYIQIECVAFLSKGWFFYPACCLEHLYDFDGWLTEKKRVCVSIMCFPLDVCTFNSYGLQRL